ncbi:uncharacterized protein LOC127882037 [Dreissena polymorpha]|uniref:Mitochondrial mRNA-processing protein COX24 C-terminal domain-containing protein n=1 Tax=Dreissena polymorpha TaxID=45954 RepID=A0A9D4H287_DREPO|nr:uncharacterized protein LOC127882037 [Dreissena polymorpha]KAH3824042.1 hypothetical protein DPMN_125870 [Dreissena polymorpha]
MAALSRKRAQLLSLFHKFEIFSIGGYKCATTLPQYGMHGQTGLPGYMYHHNLGMHGQTGPTVYQPFPITTSPPTMPHQTLALDKTLQLWDLRLPIVYYQHNLQSVGIPVEKIDIVHPTFSYDCPKNINQSSIVETPAYRKDIVPIDTPGARQIVIESPGTAVEKLAIVMVNLRRKKMRKHRLKKQRKRVWPLMRKQRFQLILKKKKKLQRRVNLFQAKAERFNAMDYIKKNLQHAKSKGFHVNILGEKSQSFGFHK